MLRPIHIFSSASAALILLIPLIMTYRPNIARTCESLNSEKKRHMRNVLNYLRGLRKSTRVLHINADYTISRI